MAETKGKEQEILLSIETVSEKLGITISTVRRMIADGFFKGAFRPSAILKNGKQKPSGPWRVPLAAVEEHIHKQKETAEKQFFIRQRSTHGKNEDKT